MSTFKIFDISGSALSAQTVRLNTTASNLANADAISSSIDQTYRARHPVFATELQGALSSEQDAVGVDVKGIVESGAPLQMEYNPAHPMADKNGYIYRSNVNVVEEMANMISASRSYQSNVEVMNTAKQLMLRTITLGQ